MRRKRMCVFGLLLAAIARAQPALVGMDQINVVIPAGIHGVVPLQINAGGVITSSQVTIAVE